MKLSHLLISVVACCALRGTAAAQETKIAYLNLNLLLVESPSGKAIEVAISKEFTKPRAALAQLEKNLTAKLAEFNRVGSTLGEAERLQRQRALIELEQDLRSKQRSLQAGIEERRQEQTAVLNERILLIVNKLNATEKYDVVVTDAYVFNPRIDITPKVLAALAK